MADSSEPDADEPDRVGKTTDVGSPVKPRLAKGLFTECVEWPLAEASELELGRPLSMIVDKPTMIGAVVELLGAESLAWLEVRAVGEGSLPREGRPTETRGWVNGEPVWRVCCPLDLVC